MKKIICLISIIVMLIIQSTLVHANEEDDEEIDLEELQSEIIQTATKPSKEPQINSKAAIVIDRNTKRILYSKNANEKRAMASTTKIMTAIIALENSSLNQTITVSKKAAAVGGSRLGLNAGDKITMNDLLYGLMMRSGNDAAAQIAETISGGYEGFARKMNEKAKELGLKNTNFVTPHGLDNEKHYTTAYELAIITDYALNNSKFAQIVNTKTKTILVNGIQRNLYNTNELLGVLNGVNGVKTGFTGMAGRCLVTSCIRGDKSIIAVVLGADTKKFRTKDSIQIIEYAFNNYKTISLKDIVRAKFDRWANENSINIIKGKKNLREFKLGKILVDKYPVKDNEEQEIKLEFEASKIMDAPIIKDTAVGKIYVTMARKKN